MFVLNRRGRLLLWSGAMVLIAGYYAIFASQLNHHYWLMLPGTPPGKEDGSSLFAFALLGVVVTFLSVPALLLAHSGVIGGVVSSRPEDGVDGATLVMITAFGMAIPLFYGVCLGPIALTKILRGEVKYLGEWHLPMRSCRVLPT